MHPKDSRIHHVYSGRSGSNTRTQRQLHSGSPTSTQVSATKILLKQLISMVQLQLTQPHIFTTIVTSKRRQVLYLSITYSMPLNGSYFILSFSIDLDWWHVSVNAVVLPITEQRNMEHVMHTTQSCTRRQVKLVCSFANMLRNNEWTY